MLPLLTMESVYGHALFVKNKFNPAKKDRVHAYIRPLKWVFSPGPNGIRALSPHRSVGFESHCFPQVLKEPVSPVLPSKFYSSQLVKIQ
jgi:hypothetical protein